MYVRVRVPLCQISRLYVVSAYAPNPTALKYDTAADLWTSRSSIPTARANTDTNGAAGVVAGRIYVLGAATSVAATVVEYYDAAVDGWSTSTAMPSGIGGQGVAAKGHRIFAVGGGYRNFPELSRCLPEVS